MTKSERKSSKIAKKFVDFMRQLEEFQEDLEMIFDDIELEFLHQKQKFYGAQWTEAKSATEVLKQFYKEETKPYYTKKVVDDPLHVSLIDETKPRVEEGFRYNTFQDYVPPPEVIMATVEMPGTHDYTSTACKHLLHERCRRWCKFCSTPCRCSCHKGQILATGWASEECRLLHHKECRDVECLCSCHKN